uniref:CCHC-type domain-containing protein n=1 Tax=Caenorhabditis japonica TaxID=281687 RepID=A0A8R1DQU3_CAEJA
MKFEMLLAEAARANTILPQGLAVMPAPAPTHQPKKAKGECFYCGIPGHFANECRRRVKDRANGIFRRENKTGFNPRSQTGFNPRSQTRSFPQNNPITNHQIFANQPTVQTIQSAVPALHAQMDALKAELEVRQNQINALIRRNDELAGSAPVTQSSNARVSCFRWSQTCLLTFLTLGSLLTPAFAVDPLVCMPHSPQYIRLPAPLDCSKASSPEPHPVVYKELTIYRPNTIAYESNGTLCKIVKRVTKYSVNMFGVRSEESTVKQLTVSSEECQNMKKFLHCNHGDLVPVNGIYKTLNDHVINWPSAPFSVFLGTQVTESTNCFLLNTRVTTRFGKETPESPAGSMAGCRFTSGFCNTREGAAFQWTPNPRQECKYLELKTMKGYMTNNIWLSKEKEFAISFDRNSTKLIDCGRKLTISDQGYGVSMATRNKRASTVDELTNFVPSNQLAAQLLAVEEAVLETTAAWFANNFMSWCSSFNAITAATHAATASNPTLAARQLLKKENIFARYIGSDVLSFQVCSPVPQDSFEFVPFTKTCYSKPALRVRLPTNTSIVTFIDLTTRVITNRAHPVECSLVTNFQYVSNKTLHSLDPFSLQLKSNSDFQLSDIPSSTALGAVPQEHLIFHNLVLGSLSENIQDTHYNEIWEALQGSPAAITRIISTHGDPNSGPLSVDDIQKAVSYWENAKWLWEIVFYAWTLVTNLLVTILVGATIVMILATNILAPYLPFKRTDFSPEQPQTPEVRLSDYTNLADRLRSPRINALSHSPEYFSAVIPLKANGINCWALIDTGASFTVAGQNIRHLLGIPKLQEPSSQTALGLGGNEVHMAGSAVVKFQIGNYTLFQTTHFTVGQCTPGGPRDYDFIIGNDALSRLPRFVLDYANGVFEVGNDKVPLGKPADQSIFPSRIAVHVLKDTIIPPLSESFVDCVLPVHNAPQDLVLISQSNTLTGQDLIIAPAVFTSKNAKILVTNPTNEAKILYANTTAASAAPRALKTVLCGLEDEALVYIDDILVYSRTFENHLSSIRKVLDRFRNFNLKASPMKCEFAKSSITFLGHEISKDSYSPNKANVAVIAAFPIPTNVSEVKRFTTTNPSTYFAMLAPWHKEQPSCKPDRITKKNTTPWRTLAGLCPIQKPGGQPSKWKWAQLYLL